MDFVIRNTKHGKGVFAARAFAKREVVMLIPNAKKISYKQLLKKKNTDNPLQISPRRYLDWGAPGVLLNHSCAPTVGLTSYPALRFIALRPIKKGEELCWDYSTSIDADTTCEFVCGCNACSCRKTIGGFTFLSSSLKARYVRFGVVQQYLL